VSTWFYDHIVVPEGTVPNVVEAMRVNVEREEAGLEGDAEMEDVE